MVFTKKITKIGNSLGITIPDNEVEFNDYKEGEFIEVRLSRAKPGESEK